MRCFTLVVLVLLNSQSLGQQASDRTQSTKTSRSFDTPASLSNTTGPTTARQSSSSFTDTIQTDSSKSRGGGSSTRSQAGFAPGSSATPSIQNTTAAGIGYTRQTVATQLKPKTVSVDFPGGTIAEYVDAIKKEADTLNLIVTESAKDLSLPKIALKNVPTHVAIKCIEQCFDANKTVVRVSGEIEGVQFIQAEVISTNQVEVINIRHLISGKKEEKENFLAAVETGLKMQSEAAANLKIKFHEETGLLFLAGEKTEIALVQQIVSELSPRPSGMMGMMMNGGGMGSGIPGGSGGIMGSGGMGSGMPAGSGGMMGSGGAGMESGMGVPGSGSGAMLPGASTGYPRGGSIGGSGGSGRRPRGGGNSGTGYGGGSAGGGVPSRLGGIDGTSRSRGAGGSTSGAFGSTAGGDAPGAGGGSKTNKKLKRSSSSSDGFNGSLPD